MKAAHLSLWLLGALAAPASAAPQAFLRFSACYVLYTAPIAPYRDASGEFIVGLPGLAALWEARTTYDAASRSATIKVGKHTLRFVDGERTVTVDGQTQTMGAAARLGGPRQVLVPLSALVHTLALPAHWDVKRHVLSLRGPNLTRGADGSWLATGGGAPDDGKVFVLKAASLRPGMSPEYHWASASARARMKVLTFTLRNASPRPARQGEYFVCAQVQGVRGNAVYTPYEPPDIRTPYPPTVPPGATHQENFQLDGPNTEDTRYAVAYVQDATFRREPDRPQ